MRHEKHIFTFILAREGLSIDDTSGWQRAPYFRTYGRGLDSKPAISSKEKLGGLPPPQNDSGSPG